MICPSWLSFILYNPIRKALTDREKILAESGVREESIVLEVGAGNGFLTEMLATHARKIYAMELQEGMVRKLRKRVSGFGQKVSVIRGDIASTVLEEGFADVCILYYSFHEFSGKEKAAENISRAVKAGGIVSLYEPTIEVDKDLMLKTASLFEQRNFVKIVEKDGFFTRFVSLKKMPFVKKQ
jgi:16S rRNA A1518/A1519 N6-dimethyltransferase RsmA/KsgA/DIM1 with predicted DNA glycosylase/AP lyase activity